MNELDSLWTLAEISIAFAGFAVIATVLHEQKGGALRSARLRIGNLIACAMAVLFLCLASASLFYIGWQDSVVWIVSSVLLFLIVASITFRGLSARRTLAAEGVALPLRWTVLQFVIAVIIIVLQIFNIGAGQFWPYFVGLSFLLLNSTISFVILVFYHLLSDE